MRSIRRDQHGLSTVELAITSAVFLVLMAVIGSTLLASLRAARFGEREAAGVDQARVAAAQIERDIRSATAVIACATDEAPADYCLRITGQQPDGSTDQIQYRALQPVSGGLTTLERRSGCDAGFAACTRTSQMVTLANRTRNEAVFRCDDSATYARVDVSLVACLSGPACSTSPTATDVLAVRSTARPRSIASSFC